MSRIIYTSNYRVETYPRRLGHFGSITVSDSFIEPNEARRIQQYKEDCESIITEIKRHVDGVGSSHVVFDSEPLCSFCGGRWTEKSETYNGGCCDKDEVNNPEPVEVAR